MTNNKENKNLQELISSKLLERGFKVTLKEFNVSDKGIFFQTEDFQTEPVIFKSMRLEADPCVIYEDGERVYIVRVRLSYDLLGGGSNGTELLTFSINDKDY